PFFINPNDFKPEIQAAVKENIGRELTIDGDLELSVFPWIGISTGKLTLSNAQGFTDKPFAKIEESNIKVKLIPLLSKKLEVSRVVLKGLVLNLAKNKQGISNWDDLSSSENSKTQSDDKSDKPDKTEDKSTSPLAALAIGGVTIEQATIVWDDQQQGQYTEISDFNFKTGRLVFDEPIDVDLSLKVFNKEPELTELISFSTELVVNEKLDVFKFNEFNLKSVSKGKDVPGEELSITLLARIALDLTRQTIEISGLKLNTANLGLSADISGTNIMDKPVFKGPINIAEFNLAQLMKDMAMPLPEMQDSAALNKLSIAFDLLATRNAANFQNLVIKLDETNIHGSTRVKNFAKPEINFDLKVDTIDVDRYLSSEKEKEKEKSK
ncbi:MAG: AsmA family protein, partial [Methylococcales bacterium]|nr:AsmA family protein [Methylococcales bacterium]